MKQKFFLRANFKLIALVIQNQVEIYHYYYDPFPIAEHYELAFKNKFDFQYLSSKKTTDCYFNHFIYICLK
jgi:hypothetical protein